MRYESDRGLADLAVGLLNGAAAHFGELIELSRSDSLYGSTRSAGPEVQAS